MAYNVSQLRKDSSTKYMQLVTIEATTLNSPNIFNQLYQDEDATTFFEDFGLTRTDKNSKEELIGFEKGHTYYLRFKIRRPKTGWYSKNERDPNASHEYRPDFSNVDVINFTILLKNKNQDAENEFPPQEIGTCTISPDIYNDREDRYANFSYVFTPLSNFDSICFRIQRDIYDVLLPDDYPNSDIAGYKRWLTNQNNGNNIYYSSTEGEVSQVFNIINGEQKYWLKVGYQSRPGSLIVINGEPIRIGRSGIYQLNNGMKIKSFMVVAPGGTDTNNIDAFLLDYAYATKQQQS